MSELTLEKIDEAIVELCKEIKSSSTDRIIALAGALGEILSARAKLTVN